MKGFIEVTDSGTKRRSLIQIKDIIEVEEQSDRTARIIVQIQFYKKSRKIELTEAQFETVETYDEVLAKIAKATESASETPAPADTVKEIKTLWEALESILDNLCYVDTPEDTRPVNYEEQKEKAFNYLDEVVEILKELGL